MLKKINFAFIVFLPGLMTTIEIPDVIKTEETKDANSLAIQHEKEIKHLNAQQENERVNLSIKQGQKKNEILTKANAFTGTLDDETVKKLKIKLDAHAQESEKEESDLQKAQDIESATLKSNQQKQIANSKSWTGKLSGLFSKDETESSNLPKSPKSPTLSKKEKTWNDSFHDALGLKNGYENDALKAVQTSPEKFASDPDFLKATLENLTRQEQLKVLNLWLRTYEKRSQSITNSIPKTAIKSLFDNLNSLLPEDERVTFYDKEINMLFSTKELLDGKASLSSINIGITKIIPLLETSNAPIVNEFNFVSNKAPSSDASYKNAIKSNQATRFAENRSLLTNGLKNYNTSDRTFILNNWIKFWQDSYNHADSLIEKNIFGKIKESSVSDANGVRESTATRFMTGAENMIINVNEILPRTQTLILTDMKGKPVNTTFLFHQLRESKANKGSSKSNFDPVKEFNPSNFKFKIIST